MSEGTEEEKAPIAEECWKKSFTSSYRQSLPAKQFSQFGEDADFRGKNTSVLNVVNCKLTHGENICMREDLRTLCVKGSPWNSSCVKIMFKIQCRCTFLWQYQIYVFFNEIRFQSLNHIHVSNMFVATNSKQLFSVLCIFITIRAFADDNMRRKCVIGKFNITWHFLQGRCYLCGLHQYNYVPVIEITQTLLKAFQYNEISLWIRIRSGCSLSVKK